MLVHRWAGLTLALFLAIAGLTGMALAWEDELEALTAPQLLRARPVAPNAKMRDPVALRDEALARHPGMIADFLPLVIKPGESLRLRASWRDPAQVPAWDELFVDPYTGRELGHRRWGDISEGWVNVMPFLYRLHYSLLLGGPGTLIMGLVALIWTLDCFAGLYLTFPVRLKKSASLSHRVGWWQRWRHSWRVRWRSGGHKLTFDLHRAGGLWVWLALLVFAWSSVSFNLPQVYAPVMGLIGATDRRADLAVLAPAKAAGAPMDFATANARGFALAQGMGATKGGARWLWHVPSSSVYVYGFTTSADVADDGGASQLAFDDRTGTLRLARPSMSASFGDRVTEWIVALHMARVGGPMWRLAVTGLGAAIAILSVTGLLIWLKKRRARLRAPKRQSVQSRS